MAAVLHTRAAGQARAAIDEIQAAVGVLPILHAGDLLTDADMASAVRCIEEQLIIIGGALGADATSVAGDVATAPDDERIPILTLAEVVARERYRRAPPRLSLVGGREA